MCYPPDAVPGQNWILRLDGSLQGRRGCRLMWPLVVALLGSLRSALLTRADLGIRCTDHVWRTTDKRRTLGAWT